MKLASFSLVLFLFVYHLKLHSDGASGDQTSAKMEANNGSIKKGKIDAIYQTRKGYPNIKQ